MIGVIAVEYQLCESAQIADGFTSHVTAKIVACAFTILLYLASVTGSIFSAFARVEILGSPVGYQQPSQDYVLTAPKISGKRCHDIIIPIARLIGTGCYQGMGKQFSTWYERGAGHMIAEDFNTLLARITGEIIVDVAHTTFSQQQMREFMQHRESSAV